MAPRRSNRQKIDELAPELTQDTPAHVTPASNKRQRTSTQPFEKGVNSITPPSTVRRPSQRPSASQAGDTEPLFVREDSDAELLTINSIRNLNFTRLPNKAGVKPV